MIRSKNLYRIADTRTIVEGKKRSLFRINYGGGGNMGMKDWNVIFGLLKRFSREKKCTFSQTVFDLMLTNFVKIYS